MNRQACIRIPATSIVPTNVTLPASVMLPTGMPNAVEMGVVKGDEEQCLRQILQLLLSRRPDGGACTYCPECAAKAAQCGQPLGYIPMIMMPMYSADSDACPPEMRRALESLSFDDKKKFKL